MIVKIAEKALQAALAKPLANLGFADRSELAYSRDHADHVDVLVFPGRLEDGTYKFACDVGVRFPAIEAILRPDDNSQFSKTVWKPIYTLCGNEYFEWQFFTESELSNIVDNVIDKVSGPASDFLSKYGRLSVVADALESPNPSDCFHLDASNMPSSARPSPSTKAMIVWLWKSLTMRWLSRVISDHFQGASSRCSKTD